MFQQKRSCSRTGWQVNSCGWRKGSEAKICWLKSMWRGFHCLWIQINCGKPSCPGCSTLSDHRIHQHSDWALTSAVLFLPVWFSPPAGAWNWSGSGCSPSSCGPSAFGRCTPRCESLSSSCVRSTLPRVSAFSTEAAGSAEEGVMLVRESENESRSALDCDGASGRPSDWLSASPSPGEPLDAWELEGTAASVLVPPFSSALLFSGSWAKTWCNWNSFSYFSGRGSNSLFQPFQLRKSELKHWASHTRVCISSVFLQGLHKHFSHFHSKERLSENTLRLWRISC